MANSDKAFMWVANDFTDEAAGALEKLAARFQNAELANTFKASFEAAQTFNQDAKAGKDDADLVFADEIEDIEEKLEDDIDVNKTADEEGNQ